MPAAGKFCSILLVQIQVEREEKLSSLRKLIECCSGNVVLPEDTCKSLDHHADKRKDFLVASANFESLLENPRLSASQMEKLHRQHDAILEDLQQSGRLLDAELPRIIDSYVMNERRVPSRYSSKCATNAGGCSHSGRSFARSQNCAKTRVTMCVSRAWSS